MENGPSLHYNGNTISAPHPGRKRLAKTRKPQDEIEFAGKNVQDREHKIVAMRRCVWCSFTDSQYFITCPICKNCQHCGMVDNVDPYRCYLCGNYLPKKLRQKSQRINAEIVRKQTDGKRKQRYDNGGSSVTIKSVNNNMAAQQEQWK